MNHNFNMGPPIPAFPMPPSGAAITAEAAAKAASDLKRQKANSGRAYATSRADTERLARRSRKMAKEFERAMEKNVKRKLDSMSGSQNNRKVGLKVAQFIPGKGMEIPGAGLDHDLSITCPLGLKGDKLCDPLEETFKQIKGRKISMDFAFKLINNNSKLLDQEKDSRVTVMNCFRHYNHKSFVFDHTGWTKDADTDAKRKANLAWHSTLGPDGSYIRKGPSGSATQADGSKIGDTGTFRGIDGSNVYTDANSYVQSGSTPTDIRDDKSNTLISPYRYPLDMELMYSRVNRPLLENYGWMLNPYKFNSFQENVYTEDDDGTAIEPNNPRLGTVSSWMNPREEIMKFDSAGFNTTKQHSFPCQVNLKNAGADTTAGFEWHSQFGPGKLSYQFQNDGTNPVCIDICIVGIKKDSPIPLSQLEAFCDFNYAVHKYSNRGKTDINGYQTSNAGSLDLTIGDSEWHANAKLPFMPDACFKQPTNILATLKDEIGALPKGDTSHGDAESAMYRLIAEGKPNPFKVVKRDQFLVSSGATRAWQTTLPSFKYRPQVHEHADLTGGTDSGVSNFDDAALEFLTNTGDEYTFVLCIGASGMPKPVQEVVTRNLPRTDDGQNMNVDIKAIIDRQPTTCNVAVVGTYTETVYPCFPKDRSSVNFINGRMTEPYFTSAPTFYEPGTNKALPNRCNTVDIATLAQTVQVATDGTLGVGAINTDLGA